MNKARSTMAPVLRRLTRCSGAHRVGAITKNSFIQATASSHCYPSARSFASASAYSGDSSITYNSPLDEVLHPAAPTPLYGIPSNEEPSGHANASSRVLECGIPEDVLRFSTMTYGRLLQAPFVHPNEHRVILRVRLNDLPLESDLELNILKEIVGTRINEERGELRLQSVEFGSRIENKRHLVSMLDKLILSVHRLTKQVQQHDQHVAA